MVLNLKVHSGAKKERRGYVHLIGSFTQQIQTTNNQSPIFHAYRQKGSRIFCKYLEQTSQLPLFQSF